MSDRRSAADGLAAMVVLSLSVFHCKYVMVAVSHPEGSGTLRGLRLNSISLQIPAPGRRIATRQFCNPPMGILLV